MDPNLACQKTLQLAQYLLLAKAPLAPLNIHMVPESAEQSSLELIQQGWIAGYPPWFHRVWIKPAQCKSDKEKTHLLELLRAIEDGNRADVVRLLPGVDANVRLTATYGTESLLEWALQKARDPDCVRLLLKAGASVESRGVTYRAVSRHDNELLADLLRAGADPNASLSNEAPLTLACWDNREAVRLLLEAGARTNGAMTVYITNNKPVAKVRPLMIAAYAGQPQIAKHLLDAGADPKAKDAQGNTATAWAKISRAKKQAEKVIALLKEAGVSPSAAAGSLPEPADFSERAKSPEFQSALELAKKLTGSSGKPIDLGSGTLEGLRAFRVRNEKAALDTLEKIRPKADALGAFAFLLEGLLQTGRTHLVLIPEAGYRKTIIAFETPNGQAVDCYDLVKWLEKLEQREPFFITHIAPDLVRARFIGKVKDPKWVAKEIQNICSDALDSPVLVLAKHLERSRELFLWWD